jgi:hypothetical protein
MKLSFVRFSLLTTACAALACLPLPLQAQNTNKPVADKQSASKSADTAKTDKAAKGGPFHGNLLAVDKVAKTISVGKRTFQVTSETRIKKAGKPATLDDGAVGETVSGYVKPASDGKLVATTINFGPKSQAENSEKQKTSTPEKEKQTK